LESALGLFSGRAANVPESHKVPLQPRRLMITPAAAGVRQAEEMSSDRHVLRPRLLEVAVSELAHVFLQERPEQLARGGLEESGERLVYGLGLFSVHDL
jgi:hypothetical protein